MNAVNSIALNRVLRKKIGSIVMTLIEFLCRTMHLCKLQTRNFIFIMATEAPPSPFSAFLTPECIFAFKKCQYWTNEELDELLKIS